MFFRASRIVGARCTAAGDHQADLVLAEASRGPKKSRARRLLRSLFDDASFAKISLLRFRSEVEENASDIEASILRTRRTESIRKLICLPSPLTPYHEIESELFPCGPFRFEDSSYSARWEHMSPLRRRPSFSERSSFRFLFFCSPPLGTLSSRLDSSSSPPHPELWLAEEPLGWHDELRIVFPLTC